VSVRYHPGMAKKKENQQGGTVLYIKQIRILNSKSLIITN
jgi:hypothetical protein